MTQSKLTRRTILKGAAAAVAAPYVITSKALGDGTTPPASDRVTLGHIGVGGRGRADLGAFRHCPNAQSVAVADAYKSRRESVAKMIDGAAYADFRELLARDDIDAVVVATPDHWHVPVANAAARAGKDCYVEKPLGLTVEQDLACRKLIKEKNLMFQYGTQQRSMSHCHRGCELVRRGAIGEIKELVVYAPNGGAGGSLEEAPVPEDLDYDMWIGPAPMKPYTRDRCKTPGTYWIYDYSIGYLGGWGAHPLDILVWGCDNDLAGPMTFEGTGVITEGCLYDTVHDWDVTVQMAGGVTLKFLPGSDLTTFVGTEGTISVARNSARNTIEPAALAETPLDGEMKLQVSTNHAQNFVDAVISRKSPVSNIEDAIRSDVISQISDIAIRLGRKVTWDPQKEEIVNDPEASKMLSREMRSPWTL